MNTRLAAVERQLLALEAEAQLQLSEEWWLGPTAAPAEKPTYPDVEGTLDSVGAWIQADATRLTVHSSRFTYSRRYLCNAGLVAERMIRLAGGQPGLWGSCDVDVADSALHELDWDNGPQFLWPWCVTARLRGRRVFVLPPQEGIDYAIVIDTTDDAGGDAVRHRAAWDDLADLAVTRVKSAVMLQAMSRPWPAAGGLRVLTMWSGQEEAERYAAGNPVVAPPRFGPGLPSLSAGATPPDSADSPDEPGTRTAEVEFLRQAAAAAPLAEAALPRHERAAMWEQRTFLDDLINDAVDVLNREAWVGPLFSVSAPMPDLRLNVIVQSPVGGLLVHASDTDVLLFAASRCVQVRPALNAVALAATAARLASTDERPDLAPFTVPSPGTRWHELGRGADIELPWPWMLVGNLKHGTITTPDGVTRPNSRIFANGAKLVLFPPMWGDGWEYIYAVGRSRFAPHRYVKTILPSKRVEHFRVQRIHRPAVLRGMSREGAGGDWWGSRERAVEFLASIHAHHPDEAAWWRANHAG